MAQAAGSAGEVYVAWEGCEGGNAIGFARSTNAGRSFSRAVALPGSRGGWDPSVAVAPSGWIYVAFMSTAGTREFPVLEVSRNRGRSFVPAARLTPPAARNWGDEDYLAVAPDGTVYITWDYGPRNAQMRQRCSNFNSCWMTAGDVNAVIQRSVDGGRRFGPIEHISPGFPDSGADAAPLTVSRNGTIDVLYQGYAVLDHRTLTLGPGYSYFTRSRDGGRHWSRPVAIDPAAGLMTVDAWWNDGAISQDAAGNLYATWDTQTYVTQTGQRNATDTGWLAYSTDGGVSWSHAIQAPADSLAAPQIIESAGGSAGVVYVAWVADHRPAGYSTYLRTYRIGVGWLGAGRRISTRFGDPAAGTGDTFGISTTAQPGAVSLSWASAVPPNRSVGAVLSVPLSVRLR